MSFPGLEPEYRQSAVLNILFNGRQILPFRTGIERNKKSGREYIETYQDFKEIHYMFLGGKEMENAEMEFITEAERKKLLWSLRSDFVWTGKKIPESVEIEGEEYRLLDMVRELGKKEFPEPDEAAEIRALIPKLRAQAKANEDMLETEELTKAEAEALYEEAVGLLRAVMELKDKLGGKSSEASAEEFKRMLTVQKVADEKRWQQFIKSIK